ncbi:tRNA lysidine(34) synthetase TilS [Neobacillus notoginsengisoli]|uniref:tRNA(Ile)-lysidine synthase n=1 Tax=Neobacillus notoginsengisoli TaxID=1578198 RepID=A0A417YG71_9BACI|nr:tRNA lysidine(34) synthetase TilS [Neobacillus notoginsengisoli]RHW31820.1 tRNA lysidine(34) synthetase TilS [Neobacillus notoginsengisoli]
MLEVKVEALLKRKSTSLEGTSILVGVSGGPDSMALLHYLQENKENWGIRLTAAHVDHMFRGEQSLHDALFVKGYCDKHSIPFEMARINVPDIIKRTGKNGQAASREARYDFFGKLMGKYGFTYLALAHHADDQIETILMRLTRGSAGKGRAGIPFMRRFHSGIIIRPFLEATKEELIDYCKRKGIEPRIDPSNEKEIYSRNRFRKTVLPFLKNENPNIHAHFQRYSEDLIIDEEYLEELAAERMVTVMKSREKGKIEIDILAFLGMPMPLQRRGIQLILNYLYEETPDSLGAIHIDQVISLLNRPHPSGSLDLPGGLTVIRSYLQCIFQFGHSEKKPFRIEVWDTGKVALPNGRVILVEASGRPVAGAGPDCTYLAVSQADLPLIIRTRENGDRMSLKGMHGSRKLKDIFIDHKVPVPERESWPVVTDSRGRILWLPGLKKSAFDSSVDSEESVWRLVYSKEPTSGGHMENEK